MTEVSHRWRPDRIAATARRRTAVDQPGRVDDLEVPAGDDVELVHDVVVEARVARAADVPGRAVVGEDHPVALERLGDGPGVGREARRVIRRLEPDAQPHRRERRRGRVAGVVAGRIDVGLAGAVGREPQRVADRPGGDLVVADETGQDRQAGRIGARPAGRPEGVGAQVPGRAAPGVPAAARLRCREQLEQPARVLVDHEDVPVGAALDLRGRRDRIADLVGLVGVLEGDRRARRRRGDDLPRDAVAGVRAEVHVQPAVEADRADHRGRVRRDLAAVDADVPDVVDGEDRARRRARHGRRLDLANARHPRSLAAGAGGGCRRRPGRCRPERHDDDQGERPRTEGTTAQGRRHARTVPAARSGRDGTEVPSPMHRGQVQASTGSHRQSGNASGPRSLSSRASPAASSGGSQLYG